MKQTRCCSIGECMRQMRDGAASLSACTCSTEIHSGNHVVFRVNVVRLVAFGQQIVSQFLRSLRSQFALCQGTPMFDLELNLLHC
jgi:hypothetical protein